MKYRLINAGDCYNYRNDILQAYQSCHLIFDSQNPYKPETAEECCDFVADYATSKDSIVYGVFDDLEEYLYGIVILDNMRGTKENTCAEVHIVNDKSVFGKKLRGVYEDLIIACGIDNLYAQIPSIAVHSIALCRRLGFKKTGYIPKALPYKNSKGEEHMYDIQIFSYSRKGENK